MSEPLDAGWIARELTTKSLALLPPAAHLCQVCAYQHPPELPHNAQTMFFQVGFRLEHDRAPTWADAVAHCDPVIRDLWLQTLRETGVDVDAGQISPDRRPVD